MSQLRAFSSTAKSLARNPLGIIALFIVLIYGFASLVVIFSEELSPAAQLPLIWFLALFPVAVLGVFARLVSQHHNKLYAPSDFKDESHFVLSQKLQLQRLPIAEQSPVSNMPEDSDGSLDTPAGRARHRDNTYGKNRGFFIVHSYEESKEPGQDFDIFIYLKRHKSKDFSDIKNVEFFLGRYWGNKIYEGKRIDNIIGIRTSAYGSFLCTCRITFEDNERVMLSRYIDFEMAQP